jgi:hypothetical protein
MPPPPRVPHVAGRIDRRTADRAALGEPLLLLLGVALALHAATARLQARAESAANHRGGRHHEDGTSDEQRDIDTEHLRHRLAMQNIAAMVRAT